MSKWWLPVVIIVLLFGAWFATCNFHHHETTHEIQWTVQSKGKNESNGVVRSWLVGVENQGQHLILKTHKGVYDRVEIGKTYRFEAKRRIAVGINPGMWTWISSVKEQP
jgi:hypothetical protein